MTEDLNEILELRKPGDPKPTKRWPICLAISNVCALLTFLAAGFVNYAYSQPCTGDYGGLFWLALFFVILPAQALSGVFLLAALLRFERPWWAYLPPFSPLVTFAIWAIRSSLQS